MLAEPLRKSNLSIGVGILLYAVGAGSCYTAADSESQVLSVLGLLSLMVGHISLIIGCTHYAYGKGYRGTTGMLAVFGLWGLLALHFLPDKLPQAKPVTSDEAQYGAA